MGPCGRQKKKKPTTFNQTEKGKNPKGTALRIDKFRKCPEFCGHSETDATDYEATKGY